jgi:hypothetical protein
MGGHVSRSFARRPVTDMVNISRAKDAAISLALTDLNSFKTQARRVRGSLVSQIEGAVTLLEAAE